MTLKKLFQPIEMPYWWQDLILVIPRAFCGYLLTSDFGAAKFGMPWSPADKNLGLFEVAFWFPSDVAAYGGVFALFPVFFAWMGAFSEAVGGLLFIFGILTRPSAFLLICTMFVAAFIQHANDEMWNMLPAISFLWVALYCLFMGSGKFGLDYFISKKLLK